MTLLPHNEILDFLNEENKKGKRERERERERERAGRGEWEKIYFLQNKDYVCIILVLW